MKEKRKAEKQNKRKVKTKEEAIKWKVEFFPFLKSLNLNFSCSGVYDLHHQISPNQFFWTLTEKRVFGKRVFSH